MLDLFGGVAGTCRGFTLTGKDIIFCEQDETQMSMAIDRMMNWSNELQQYWASTIVAPMQAMLVQKDDHMEYDADELDKVRFVPNPRLFDPVPSESQRDFDRLYGGCTNLLVRINI